MNIIMNIIIIISMMIKYSGNNMKSIIFSLYKNDPEIWMISKSRIIIGRILKFIGSEIRIN
jgi:hypothetical protein